MVLRVSLRAPVAQRPAVLFRTEPANEPVVRHRYGATARPAGLGQNEGILQAGASVSDGRIGAGDLPAISSAFPETRLLEIRAAVPRRLWLLVVRMLRAVAASRTRRAASIPNVPHQAGHQEPALAVDGIATSDGTRSAVASSTNSLLFVDQHAKFPELQVLTNHLLLFALQFCQLLKIQRHLLTHNAGAEATQTLPLARHSLALLPVIVQEAAQVSQFPIVILQLLVYLLNITTENTKNV